MCNTPPDVSNIKTGFFLCEHADQRLHKLVQLHSDPNHYHYAIKMPFPLATRDYVYTLRTWTDSSTHRLVEGMANPHSSKPEIKGTVRIEDFYQQIAVKSVQGPDGNEACMLAMRYYDNPRGSIPTVVLNFAAQKGVPSFIHGLVAACQKYEAWLKSSS
jgi:hypothetical protein